MMPPRNAADVSRRRGQRSLLALGAAVLALAASCTAFAQTPPPGKSGQPLISPRPGSSVKAQFGDWKHECSKPPP